jgi:ribosomal protein S18 acetylase RimI-like enzyme
MAVKALRRTWARAADGRDARALLHLHRELWVDHDGRGGMPAAPEDEVWAAYGILLDRQLAHRDGRRNAKGVFEGKLGHVVAELDGRVVGQVEAYLDRFGYHARTPSVAELRSLIVTQSARGNGLGAALVREVAEAARARAGENTIVSAEVLARNEALSFYDRLGFRTLERISAITEPREYRGTFTCAPARVEEAMELAILDHQARVRRHAWGDPRFDPPAPAIGGDLVRLIADGIALDDAQRGTEVGRLREELIVRDRRGRARAALYLVSAVLGPPFSPVVRAEVARVAADPEDPEALEAAMAGLDDALERVRAVGATQLLVRSAYVDPIGARVATGTGVRGFSWILAAPVQTVLRRTTKP